MDDYFRIRLELREWKWTESYSPIGRMEVVSDSRIAFNATRDIPRKDFPPLGGWVDHTKYPWRGRYAEILNAPPWTYEQIFSHPPEGWYAERDSHDPEQLVYRHTSGAIFVLTREVRGRAVSQHGSSAVAGAPLVEVSKALLEMSYALAEAHELAKLKPAPTEPPMPKGWMPDEENVCLCTNTDQPEFRVDMRFVSIEETEKLAYELLALARWRREVEMVRAQKRRPEE